MITLLILLLTLPFLYPQDSLLKRPAAAKASFEVSTIEPSDARPRGFSIQVTPASPQLRMKAMMQGLFADRLYLTFHHEEPPTSSQKRRAEQNRRRIIQIRTAS